MLSAKQNSYLWPHSSNDVELSFWDFALGHDTILVFTEKAITLYLPDLNLCVLQLHSYFIKLKIQVYNFSCTCKFIHRYF